MRGSTPAATPPRRNPGAPARDSAPGHLTIQHTKEHGILMEPILQADLPDLRAKRPNDYADLKALVRAAGLFEPRLGYYAVKITYTLAMLLAGVVGLVLIDNLLFRVVDCVYLAVVFAQLGFLGHDVGHRQVFTTRRAHE